VALDAAIRLVFLALDGSSRGVEDSLVAVPSAIAEALRLRVFAGAVVPVAAGVDERFNVAELDAFLYDRRTMADGFGVVSESLVAAESEAVSFCAELRDRVMGPFAGTSGFI
jgi:hypothetical protein